MLIDIHGCGYLFSVFVGADVKNNADIRGCGCGYPVKTLIS